MSDKILKLDQAQTLYNDLRGRIDALPLDEKADIIINSASGPIASFSDSADDMPLKSCVVEIEPVQDLHGYNNPWPAGGGKQLLNPSEFGSFPRTTSGITATLNSDGTFTLNGTATENLYMSVMEYRLLSDFGFIEPNVSYTLSGYDSKAIVGFGVYGSGTDYWATSEGKLMQFTAEQLSSQQYRLIIRVLSGETLSNVIIKPMICKSSASDPATFAPYSNICPITGRTGTNVQRTGKNLLHFNASTITQVGVTMTVNNDGSLSFSGTAQANTNFFLNAGSQDFPNGSYVFSGCPSGGGTTTYYLRIDNKFGNGLAYSYGGTSGEKVNFTVEDGKLYTLYINVKSGVNMDGKVFYPMIRQAVVDNAGYEPYQGHTYPINWQTEAGTVYGGTLDMTTGTLVVDRAIVDMGSLVWSKGSAEGRFYVPEAPSYKKKTGLYMLCSCYKCDGNGGSAGNYYGANGTIRYYFAQSAPESKYHELYVHDDFRGSMTAEEFKNSMTNQQLIYELAEPITYQLTATEIRTLLGQNNIWADCGDTTVEYPANTKAYVDGSIPAVPVMDVQINGTSILNNGVANVPIGGNNLGVFYTNTTYGVGSTSAGLLAISGADDSQMKAGTNSYKPISAAKQHISAFYGLAKAAGDTTQKNSNNSVGSYTDTAKGAIQKMLGISNLIAPEENDLVADQAYAIGDIFTSGGKLYKATSAIAFGGTIVPTTNCVETNVIDEVAAKLDAAEAGLKVVRLI